MSIPNPLNIAVDELILAVKREGHYRVIPEAKGIPPKQRSYEIPCHRGKRFGKRKAHLYVHSATHWGYSGVGRKLRKELVGMGAQVWQNGDDEFSVIFPMARFEEFATVVRAAVTRKWALIAATKAAELSAKMELALPAPQSSEALECP